MCQRARQGAGEHSDESIDAAWDMHQTPRRRRAPTLGGNALGPGVGAVGMCLTGNFALALMVDFAYFGWIFMTQPAVPLPLPPGCVP